MPNNIYILKNLDETKILASIIAKVAQPNLILLLTGNLGSGKTQLAKLIGLKLGVNEIINSPTFIIWNQYQTKYDWKLIHIDAYRLTNNQNLDEYYEIMNNNFTIIEWPNKLTLNYQYYSYLAINFNITNLTSREITISTNLWQTNDELKLKKMLSVLLPKN